MKHRLNANSSSTAGFTLIEFCIAVLIMMVGLLGLLQAINVANEHNLGTMLRNEAVSLADEQMVVAKLIPFDSLGSNSSYVNRKTRAGFGNYSVVRTTQVVHSTPDPITGVLITSSQKVDIRVTWRYKKSRLNHSVSTLVTNPVL